MMIEVPTGMCSSLEEGGTEVPVSGRDGSGSDRIADTRDCVRHDRVINAADGELLREMIIDPRRATNPRGNHRGQATDFAGVRSLLGQVEPVIT